MSDNPDRYMTKIVREMNKFTAMNGKMHGIGSSEADVIHLVRHHPGISQQEIAEELGIDKAAVARQCSNLEKKGYLIRKPSSKDGRAKALFPTAQAEELKNEKTNTEEIFYEWLFADLGEEERNTFFEILTKLYHRSKTESRGGFTHLREKLK